VGSLSLFRIKQYVSGDSCARCLGCCRYNCSPSIWAPVLLEEEKRALNLPRIELVVYQQSYVCCFLNPQSNLCRIYAQRPLECRLYPFLLNRCGNKLYLGFDSRCPGAAGKIDSQEFKKYLEYLTRYLGKAAVLNMLRKNRAAFSSYPAEEILNLAELKI